VGREGLLGRDPGSPREEDGSDAPGRAPRREAEAGRSAHHERLFDGRADDAGEAGRSRQAALPPSVGRCAIKRASASISTGARLYGGRALSQAPLEEFQRARDRTAARIGQAREEGARPRGLITPGLPRDGTPAISRKLRVYPGRSPGVATRGNPANRQNPKAKSPWIAPQEVAGSSPASSIRGHCPSVRRRCRSTRGRRSWRSQLMGMQKGPLLTGRVRPDWPTLTVADAPGTGWIIAPPRAH
jgi:hypothetical protein